MYFFRQPEDYGSFKIMKLSVRDWKRKWLL